MKTLEEITQKIKEDAEKNPDGQTSVSYETLLKLIHILSMYEEFKKVEEALFTILDPGEQGSGATAIFQCESGTGRYRVMLSGNKVFENDELFPAILAAAARLRELRGE